MKLRYRFKKRSSSLVTLVACALFIWLATAKLGLPKEKVLLWAGMLVALLLVLMAFAAMVAFLLRLYLGRNDK